MLCCVHTCILMTAGAYGAVSFKKINAAPVRFIVLSPKYYVLIKLEIHAIPLSSESSFCCFLVEDHFLGF